MTTTSSTSSSTQVFSISSLETLSKKTETADTSMGKDAFLKLLVAQLRYQDPMNPTDSQSYMTQTAQFTQVEKLEEIAASIKSTNTNAGLSTASALLGKTVTFANGDGTVSSGVVSAIASTADGVTLSVGEKSTTLEKVTKIENASS